MNPASRTKEKKGVCVTETQRYKSNIFVLMKYNYFLMTRYWFALFMLTMISTGAILDQIKSEEVYWVIDIILFLAAFFFFALSYDHYKRCKKRGWI